MFQNRAQLLTKGCVSPASFSPGWMHVLAGSPSELPSSVTWLLGSSSEGVGLTRCPPRSKEAIYNLQMAERGSEIDFWPLLVVIILESSTTVHSSPVTGWGRFHDSHHKYLECLQYVRYPVKF